MTRTPRQESLALIAEHGADLLDSTTGSGLAVNVWAPAGRAWVDTGCHSLSLHYYTDRPAAWRELRDRLRLGTQPCTAEQCDTCDEAATQRRCPNDGTLLDAVDDQQYHCSECGDEWHEDHFADDAPGDRATGGGSAT
jgi:hypothetical protein